jgi:hypothetical protein
MAPTAGSKARQWAQLNFADVGKIRQARPSARQQYSTLALTCTSPLSRLMVAFP